MIAVHTTCSKPGVCDNLGVRLTLEMISHFVRRAGRIKALESVRFRKIYLNCNGKKAAHSGKGKVNAQYGLAEEQKFFIYPVQMYPSGLASASRNRCEFVIESVRYKGVFLWLDGSGMDKPNPFGGGVVNCQTEVRKFYINTDHKDGERVSVVSVNYPNLRIRLEGLGCICMPIPGGFGVVNCQYYNDVEEDAPPASYELFRLHAL